MLLRTSIPFWRRFCSKSKMMQDLAVPEGTIRGTVSTDLDGDKYYKFQGIPYAKPPIGNLRFKAPVPIEPWSGFFDATKEGSPCYSRHALQRRKIEGSEDCLYLNVYTKNLTGKHLRPVMFWIHGGAFVFGNGGTEFYGPDFLMAEDVVVVTVNYRLGILGFLSFEDPTLEVPGNAGFKDVVMALKWVRKNIAKFGGDPKNVTIFGQSTGATAVHLLMLSQMSRGLFHKAIAQSGSALNTWARVTKGVRPYIDPNVSEKELHKKFMGMPVHELFKIQKKIDTIQDYVPSLQRPFGYVVEKPNKQALISEDPFSIISQGDFEQVPLLAGHTSRETIPFTAFRKTVWPGFQTCEDQIPFRLGYTMGSEESDALGKQLRKFYFGNDHLVEENLQRLMMEGDINYMYGVQLTVMNHLKKSTAPIYLYRMSIETNLNFMKEILKCKLPGTAHSDDLGYLFKNVTTPKFKPGSPEDVAVRRFVRLWTNFAKYGNPTRFKEDPLLPINWKPVTTENMHCLDFGNELVVLSESEDTKRARFLKYLFKD